jgi:hypothetical protein
MPLTTDRRGDMTGNRDIKEGLEAERQFKD